MTDFEVQGLNKPIPTYVHEHEQHYPGMEDDVLTERNGVVRCSYCGSLAPSEVVKALAKGARVEAADRKYGWPHKWYIVGGDPGHAKFYSVHLQDATAEEKVIIERSLGITYLFERGIIKWRAVVQPAQPTTDSPVAPAAPEAPEGGAAA